MDREGEQGRCVDLREVKKEGEKRRRRKKNGRGMNVREGGMR